MRPMITSAGACGGHLMDKQSLVPAVEELWNAWEIHLMILLSLSLQVFLFLFADMRMRSSNWFLQTVLWLAYLSADAVAVFVLGHLAVRVREPGHELVALWAPFVLVHLGGQDSITAFSKQDNDLWRRHLLNLVIQAVVAGYVVAKSSWPDDRIRDAMVIMFLCGCFKYGERVLCLFFGSADYLYKGVGHSAWWGQLTGNRGLLPASLYVCRPGNVFVWETRFSRDKHLGTEGVQLGMELERERRERTMGEVKKDLSDTHDMMSKGKGSSLWPPPRVLRSDAGTIIQDIISLDAPLNKADNITVAAHGDILRGMLKGFPSSHNAYEYVGAVLEYCYRVLYTKDRIRLVLGSSLQTCTYLFASLLLILVTTVASSIALALFMSAHKRDQLHNSNRVDITVTYALLVGAIVLDVSSAAKLIFLHLSFYLRPCLAKSTDQSCCAKLCSQKLGQYNIIIDNRPFTLPWLPRVLNCKADVTKDHMSTKKFILDTLLASGTRNEWSIASTRGKLALQKWMDCQKNHDLATTTKTLKSLEEIITSSADFPTSVLVMHVATDICYHYGDGGGTNSHHQALKNHKQISTELSNYIMYLVFKCGAMLTSNSEFVHINAGREIRKVLLPVPVNNHKDDTLKLFDAIRKKQQDSMGEIKIMHQESEQQQDPTIEIKNQESEEQQNSTIEIENQESTDVDDDNADVENHIKKLRMNSKTLKSPVLPRAVAVAQELIGIENEAERWELIAKVWAEMLYYTAPRCGGDFHYEHLSTGGEFVTHVLLLMYYLGPFLPPPS